MASKTNPIKTKTLPDGSTVYWFRVDIGHDPVTGKRKQLYKSFQKLKDAKAEYSKVTNAVNQGTHVAKTKLTLSAYIDAFLPGHCRDLEEATKRNYVDALKPARERLGAREFQSIEKKDVEALVDWMSTSGRKRGGVVGTGLGPRTIKLTLNALSLVFDMGVMERKISMNPVSLVKPPKLVKPEHVIWSDAEEDKFFATAADDRLSAVIDIFGLGLRPEEVCGLRWTDVKLKSLTIDAGQNVRTWVAGVGAVEKSAKTAAGVRTLPIDAERGNALRAWRKVQAAEKLAAGPGVYEDGGYVLCDELGRPFDPPKLRRYMHRLMKSAKVRRVTPYEAMRHAAGSRLARAGVPGHQIAAWLGHTDPSFTYATYIHARPEDLATARDALTRASDSSCNSRAIGA